VAENSTVFKQDFKEASEGADQRSSSREFHVEGTTVEKVLGAKYEVTAGFENRKQMMTRIVWPVDSLTVV